MGRIDIARGDCEQVDVTLHDGMRQAGRLADGQLVEGTFSMKRSAVPSDMMPILEHVGARTLQGGAPLG
ncbi:MAG: hypothetical protein WDO24_12200 [Pseudomonadota bacterium]